MSETENLYLLRHKDHRSQEYGDPMGNGVISCLSLKLVTVGLESEVVEWTNWRRGGKDWSVGVFGRFLPSGGRR